MEDIIEKSYSLAEKKYDEFGIKTEEIIKN